MNKTDEIANEMAETIAEIAAEMEADSAEKARKYKIASIFLAERMLDDLKGVNRRVGLREAVGSYIIRQRKVAEASLAARITDSENLISFLKEADNDYFGGRESEQLLKMFADYFRGDCNNLQLAKISHDIEDFRLANINPGKTVSDVIIESLEDSVRDIFKE